MAANKKTPFYRVTVLLNPCQDGINTPMGLGIVLQNNNTSVQRTKHI